MIRRAAIGLTLTLLISFAQPAVGATAYAVSPQLTSSALDPDFFGVTLSPVTAVSGETLLFNTDTGQITKNGTTIRPAGDNSVSNGIGVRVNPSGTGVTAFHMGSLTVASGATVQYAGSKPLGLLTTGDVAIAGAVTADAAGAAAHTGSGAGSSGGCTSAVAAGGGGAGYAAAGGSGGGATPIAGGAGGVSYGTTDISSAPFLVGSGGGDGGSPGACSTVSHGGRGGGGLMVIALGNVDVSGAFLSAAGGNATTTTCSAGGGGGSGGSLLIVTPNYTDTAATTFRLRGGDGANGSSCGGHPVGGGGTGASGRLTIVGAGTRQGAVSPIQPFAGSGAGGGQSGTTGGAATTSARAFGYAAGPSTGDVGAPLDFSAGVEIGAVDSYHWDFGDGTTATTATGAATHTFGSADTFTVTATATMKTSGALSSASTSVDVSDVAITGLVASNNGPTADGARTRLSAQIDTGTNVTYTWDFGDGTNGVGKSVRHRYSASGNYLATVTATNTINSPSAQTEVVVDDPFVSIGPASVVEGTAPLPGGAKFTQLRFRITLSGASDQSVSVVATTSDGTAVAPGDYRAKSDTVTIPAGKKSGTFVVSVRPDSLIEGNEQFSVTLSAPTHATLGTATALGTILDDD